MTKTAKHPGHDWNRFKQTGEVSPHWRLNGEDSVTVNPRIQRERDERKNSGGSWFNVAHNTTSGCGRNDPRDDIKVRAHLNQRNGHRSTSHLTNPAEHIKWGGDDAFGSSNRDHVKGGEYDLGDKGFNVAAAERYGHMVDGVRIERTEEDIRNHVGAKRKFASAMIAKIPLQLARHVARTFYPR